VSVLGPLPQGLPLPQIPFMRTSDFVSILRCTQSGTS
jgi:hypothetical protein